MREVDGDAGSEVSVVERSGGDERRLAEQERQGWPYTAAGAGDGNFDRGVARWVGGCRYGDWRDDMGVDGGEMVVDEPISILEGGIARVFATFEIPYFWAYLPGDGGHVRADTGRIRLAGNGLFDVEVQYFAIAYR